MDELIQALVMIVANVPAARMSLNSLRLAARSVRITRHLTDHLHLAQGLEVNRDLAEHQGATRCCARWSPRGCSSAPSHF